MPPEIVSRLVSDVKSAMQDQGLRDRLRALATNAASNTPTEFTERIATELKVWGSVAKTANVTIE